MSSRADNPWGFSASRCSNVIRSAAKIPAMHNASTMNVIGTDLRIAKLPRALGRVIEHEGLDKGMGTEELILKFACGPSQIPLSSSADGRDLDLMVVEVEPVQGC